MDLVVTAAGMRSIDRYAVRRYGIPDSLLMENAGRRVAAVAFESMRRAGLNSATIVCGTGNNGGDGLVAARHLIGMGASVRVILLGRPARLRGETRLNHAILTRLRTGTGVRGRLEIVSDPAARNIAGKQGTSVVVDAIFGTGFHGRLTGGALKAVSWINDQRAPVIAVDIPSGLDADNGTFAGPCVRATSTVTMGALKAGLLVGQGPSVCGEIIVAGLGISLPPRPPAGAWIRRVTPADAYLALPARPLNSHKHSAGKILILAGSVGYTGAAALTASAALKSGAGVVVLAVPLSIYPILSKKLTEVIVKPVPETIDGTFCETTLESLERELQWADVLVVGPGIGRSEGTRSLLKNLLKLTGKQLLIDADGLTLIAEDKALWGILRRNTCILTPHAGEFSRLTGLSVDRIEAGRVERARSFAKSKKIHLVLKGAPTLVADPAGKVYINQGGNPGMSSAGMGDLLSGMIAALWAESGKAAAAAYAGVSLHGQAGDMAANRIGYRGITARDLLNEIPYLFKLQTINPHA